MKQILLLFVVQNKDGIKCVIKRTATTTTVNRLTNIIAFIFYLFFVSFAFTTVFISTHFILLRSHSVGRYNVPAKFDCPENEKTTRIKIKLSDRWHTEHDDPDHRQNQSSKCNLRRPFKWDNNDIGYRQIHATTNKKKSDFFPFSFVHFEFMYLFVCVAIVCSSVGFQWHSRNDNGSFVAFDVFTGGEWWNYDVLLYVNETPIILEQILLWKSQPMNKYRNWDIIGNDQSINYPHAVFGAFRSYCAHCPHFFSTDGRNCQWHLCQNYSKSTAH